MHVCVCVCVCVCWRLCSVESNTLRSFRTAAHQAPLSFGFSRQEYWMGCRFPSKNDAYVLHMNEIKGERPDILHADLQIHKTTCSQVYTSVFCFIFYFLLWWLKKGRMFKINKSYNVLFFLWNDRKNIDITSAWPYTQNQGWGV